MEFILQKTSSQTSARAGLLRLAHGIVPTPIFMPVGTQASIKALDFNDLLNLAVNFGDLDSIESSKSIESKSIEHKAAQSPNNETKELKGAPIILANTYHLYLRPGAEIMRQLGGLHDFCGYKRNFLTDSGGFQAFSLNGKRADLGIEFRSHIDGSLHFFTPQSVLDTQYALNSDIMMILDDLVGLPASEQRILDSINRTSRWAEIAINYHLEQKAKNAERGRILSNNIFAINQGGTNAKFRKASARDLVSLPFDGYAIGGLAVGESAEEMYETLDFTTPLLPKDKPRYLMGVGTPQNIIEAIARGVDMFDCVMPTRNARNGTIFTRFGRLSIKATKFECDESPLDKTCSCYTCQNFSRAYLRHLFRAGEPSFMRLVSIHNLSYYLNLVYEARAAILEDRFNDFYKNFYENLKIES